ERALQLLDHPVLSDRDDGRRTGRKAVADLLQILILETLVPNLAPHPAGTAGHGGGDDDAGREDQPDDTTRDSPSLRPPLPARISGLLELDLAVCGVDDHRRIEQVDRT